MKLWVLALLILVIIVLVTLFIVLSGHIQTSACVEINDMECNSSFSDSFVLKYNESGNAESGGNWVHMSYKGIELESEKYIIKGSVMTYSCSACGAACVGMEPPCEPKKEYFDVPANNSIVKANFTVDCYSAKNETKKRLNGLIEYKNSSIEIGGWYGSDLDYICK
jgi:hypothetical protein